MTLVIIPSRMGSKRLPGKPLADIGGKTLIERCVGQAKKAGFEPIVATDADVTKWPFLNCEIVKTGECASGTDRVAAAAEIIDPEGVHKHVINYQGDQPFLDPEWLKKFVWLTEQSKWGITTAFCDLEIVEMCRPYYRRVKVESHIGLYGFERGTLRSFASLPQSPSEISDRLEQSRAPQNFKWEYVEFPSMPIEINTQADLERARSCLS